jgi:hypothetical protein
MVILLEGNSGVLGGTYGDFWSSFHIFLAHLYIMVDKASVIQLLSFYGNEMPLLNLAGTKVWCRLCACHDANTMQMTFEIGGTVHKFIVRVMQVDSPEMTSKDAIVKAWAVKARNWTLSLLAPDVFTLDGTYTKKDILKKLRANVVVLWIDALQYDKYKRLLANLHFSPGNPIIVQSILVVRSSSESCSSSARHRVQKYRSSSLCDLQDPGLGIIARV